MKLGYPNQSFAGNFLGRVPESARISSFKGPRDTLKAMERIALGPRGEQSLMVRQFTEWVTRDVWPKDYLGEILAIRNVQVQESPFRKDARLLRYLNDPRHVEWIKDPQRIVEEIHNQGSSSIDCFPEGTLLLDDSYNLRAIETILPGEKIWGFDKWSTVKAKVYKGLLSVDVICLSNGAKIPLTSDHKVMIAECPEHKHLVKRCFCPMSKRIGVETRVSDVEPGMRFMQPDRIPFGSVEMDPELAWVEGVYVADGWCQKTSFAISGQDGCPKEEQKREVQRICEKRDIRTRWDRKSICVCDKEWTLRMQQMGLRAPEKHLLSLDLTEDSAKALLRGVMADSGKNTGTESRTFSSTSKLLAIQVRVLHKMLGIPCGMRRLDKHGGFGKNPIWRLGQRISSKRRGLPLVKEVLRGVADDVPCYDIQTDDHHVYLPEYDVTVHNCDEVALLAATMGMQLGREVEFVALGFSPGNLTHVGTRIKEPKTGQWIWVDPVAGPREREAAATAKEMLIWSLD